MKIKKEKNVYDHFESISEHIKGLKDRREFLLGEISDLEERLKVLGEGLQELLKSTKIKE